jgi:hypothetical protein
MREAEVEMTNEKPWRVADPLADLTFVPFDNGMERATINGGQIVRQNGRYWIMTHSGPQWSDIGERDCHSSGRRPASSGRSHSVSCAVVASPS